MKSLNIGLFGATGRMGQEIVQVLTQEKGVELSLGVGRKTKVAPADLKKTDVWIDFSTPEALEQNLKWALLAKKPFVCGTTGINEKQKQLLKAAAKKIPVLWASNMSLGVAVLSEALRAFSALHHFDFQIEEIHHIHKKDRPSGTAITLQNTLEEVVERKLPPPLAIRGGGVFGVHKVFAMSADEVLTFEHTALNRSVFARGAVQAARWIEKRPAGFYGMRECLFGS